jgi:hypothetical protein
VADPGFETRVFPLAMEKTSMSKPLDTGAQADGEHVLQRPVDVDQSTSSIFSRIRGHPYWIRP